jgi:hypothetical protein
MGMMNQSTLMVLCNSTQKEVLAKSRSLANAVQTNHRLVPIPSGPEADLVIVTICHGTAATDNWPLPESAFAGERTFELPQNFAIHFHPGAGTIEEFAGVRLMDSFPKLPLFIGGIFMNLCDESKSGKVWTLGPTFYGVGAFWRQEEFAVVLSQSDGVALASVPGSVERIDGDERLRKVMGHGNQVARPVSALYLAHQASTGFCTSFRSLCQIFCSTYDSSSLSQSTPVKKTSGASSNPGKDANSQSLE